MNTDEEIKNEDVKTEEQENVIKYATIDDLSKIKVAIGTILSVEDVEGSDKLLKLSVDFGEAMPRQILSGIKKYFADPQLLVNTQTTFVVNLAPRTMMGMDSNGMLYAGGADGELVLLRPEHTVSPGTPMH
jgi:methionyl-tRNA synthetase